MNSKLLQQFPRGMFSDFRNDCRFKKIVLKMFIILKTYLQIV